MTTARIGVRNWIARALGSRQIGRLSFADPALERRFERQDAVETRTAYRRAILMGAVAISLFTVFDVVFFEPPVSRRLVLIRDVVAMFGFATGLALTFTPTFERHSRLIGSLVVTWVGMCVWLMILVGTKPLVHMYYVGIIITILFDAFLFATSYLYFAVTATGLLTFYILGAVWLFEMPPSTMCISSFFVTVAVGAGIMASYAREQQARDAFRLRESLRAERDKVAEINRDLEHRVASRVAQAMALSTNLQREAVERQTVERQLASERDISTSLLDAMGDILVVFDPTTGWPVRWNRAATVITGFEQEDLASMRIPQDWFAEQDQQRVFQAIQDIKEHGKAVITLQIQCADGSLAPTEFVGALVTPTHGTRPLVIAIGRDLRERIESQQALRTSRERLELALQSADMGIWEYDWHTERIMLDERCHDLLQVSSGPRTRVMQQMAATVAPENHAALGRMFAAHIGGAQPHFQTEFAYRHAGRLRRMAMWGRIAEYDPSGAPLLTVGLMRDVTEAHDLEERLRETAKLEAIGRLAGGVAHDFNNLLTVINGYGEMALIGLDPEDELHDFIQVILEQGQRAAGLTRQLLAFSRREELRIETLDLNALIQNLAKMLRRLIGEDVELVIRFDTEPALVEGDNTQLEQVIMNLAVNARDAMPNGGTLSIGMDTVSLDEPLLTRWTNLPPGRYVLLSVVDSGSGIPDQVMEHLFEPFYTTKKRGEGTGLGLAVVYGVIDRLGGGLVVETKVRQGTAFNIYLPASDRSLAESQDYAPVMSRGDETILLVEDEDAVRALVRRKLESWGYRVLQARHGMEALNLANTLSTPCDLLLTDVVMPKMTGDALAAELRQNWPGLKVVYITGYNNRLDKTRLDANSRLLAKPLDQHKLAKTLRELLDPIEPE